MKIQFVIRPLYLPGTGFWASLETKIIGLAEVESKRLKYLSLNFRQMDNESASFFFMFLIPF